MRRIVSVMAVILALVPAGFAFGQEVEVRVLSPMRGETVIGSSVTVHFEASGLKIVPTSVKVEDFGKRPDVNRDGEGHVHLMLDLQPMMIWESAEPYTFDTVAVGDHVLTVELVQNDHRSFVPPRVEQIRFTSVAATTATASTALTLPNTGITGLNRGSTTLVLLSISLLVIGTTLRRRAHR